MPSVMAFYYELATYVGYSSIILSMSTIVICSYTCHVGKLEQHQNLNILPTYVATKKPNKLDDRKNFQF